MSNPALEEKIIQALAEYLKRDTGAIKPSHHLRDDLGLDSMAVIELLYKIEEVFNFQIPDQDLVGLTTVGSVAAYVEKRLAPAPTSILPGRQAKSSLKPGTSSKPKKKSR
jgi:acyl carrier protein